MGILACGAAGRVTQNLDLGRRLGNFNDRCLGVKNSNKNTAEYLNLSLCSIYAFLEFLALLGRLPLCIRE